MKFRVGVVDDNPAAVLGLTAIINAEPDMHVVAFASSPQALLREHTSFDAVILNLVSSDPHAVRRELRVLSPTEAHVVAYVNADQRRVVAVATQSGAAAILHKTDPPRRVTQTLRAVLHAAPPVVRAPRVAVVSDDDPELSPREREVLALYAAGETADSVAAQLFLSRETVISHIRRIRSKYAAVGRPARQRVDLFRRAVEDGIVPPT